MNFLAHLYLAGDSESLIIGNFIGDFVKGQLKDQFPPEIIKGISMHREIDFYTDNHPIVLESKIRLRSRYRHYSGVLVDIYYDHLLAVNWSTYSKVSLENFTQNKYALLMSKMEILPEKVKYMLPHMINDNWLLNYRNVEGIGRSLNGMARRTKFNSGLETGIFELMSNYSLFDQEFNAFFPELIEYVNQLKLK
ncbi:acyl carrier protein phosphodiesterase [soil metagenome]|jgi:acyl carrier protein phosphodiesterase